MHLSRGQPAASAVGERSSPKGTEPAWFNLSAVSPSGVQPAVRRQPPARPHDARRAAASARASASSDAGGGARPAERATACAARPLSVSRPSCRLSERSGTAGCAEVIVSERPRAPLTAGGLSSSHVGRLSRGHRRRSLFIPPGGPDRSPGTAGCRTRKV